ncbi:MAG: ATP-binding protein [Deltaproteobacteria bacterium]|nr:ATP-binding protein [Deltaproteobacteria bacterium]
MDPEIAETLESQNPWWFGMVPDTGVPRLKYYPDIMSYMKTPEIVMLLGARRTGKSTLMYQLIGTLGAAPKSILFINLDDPILMKMSGDAGFLKTLIDEYTTENRFEKYYIFIDEIQNNEYWSETLKILYDTRKDIKFVLSGSTSTLIKGKASMKLSGRYLATTVHTLSFGEYLDFIDAKNPTSTEKRLLVQKYIEYGSFPRIVLEKDDRIRVDLLKNYFETIYLKDIIFPNRLRNNRDVFNLLYFLLSNVSKPISYTKTGKSLDISPDTVKEYLEYAKDSYLIYSVSKFEYSARKQILNPQKIYCVDTGLANSVSFRFSENRGRMMENAVFLELARRGVNAYYHKDKVECDFVVVEGREITDAIQVTVSLEDEAVRKREIRGLMDALSSYGLKEGKIITENERSELSVEDKKIRIVPMHEWLLEK